MITKEEILLLLPPFKNERVVIKENQRVHDIINLILDAHEANGKYYQLFALKFDADNIEKICINISRFINANIRYQEESEEMQTVQIPSGFLTDGKGDCKHYASFAGGILSAINQLTGKKIKWCYRFCSYKMLDRSPHHVFVVVFDGVHEYWIDPVPGADKANPVWMIDKFIKTTSMPLVNVIGNIGGTDTDEQLSPEIHAAVNTLMSFDIVNSDGTVNWGRYEQAMQYLDPASKMQIQNAIDTITQGATLSGVISDALHAVAKVTLAIPRNAYLLLLRVNFKNWAEKAMDILQYGGKEKGDQLFNKWFSVGGSWDAFVKAVEEGHTKKSIGSASIGVEPVTTGVAAALTAAAPIIAALVPLIMTLVNGISKPQEPIYPGGTPVIDPNNPIYQQPTSTNFFDKIMDFVRANPLIVGAVAFGGYYFLSRKNKVGAAGDNNMLLIGGAGLAAFLLLRKKAGTTTPVVDMPVNNFPKPQLQITDNIVHVDPSGTTQPTTQPTTSTILPIDLTKDQPANDYPVDDRIYPDYDVKDYPVDVVEEPIMDSNYRDPGLVEDPFNSGGGGRIVDYGQPVDVVEDTMYLKPLNYTY